jgi:hypothetical protein
MGCEGMKITGKSLIRDEKGQTLILALILLIVGGLIIAPLLAYMNTGLLAGGVYERKAAELYAADAGVEDAVWKIQSNVTEVYYLYCGQGNHTLTYPKDDDPPIIVNGKNVEVTIAWVNNLTYQVESIATGDGSGTRIEAYITGKSKYLDFSGITDHIITSQNETDIKGKVTLNCTGDHNLTEYYKGSWPTPTELEDFYWQYVKNVAPYTSGNMTLNGDDMTKGPLYRDGALSITSSNNKKTLALTLDGTLYVTGITQIGSTDNDFILNLNGNTVFVASSSTGKGDEALQIGGKCTIEGPGAIIAIGDIYFAPNGDAGSNGNPVFVLSVSGSTTVRPGISIYGALAGSVSVDAQSGSKPTINYPNGGFRGVIDFPGCIPNPLVYSIASWEVSPL